MESDQLNYSVIARYLSGVCTNKELEIIEQWMGEDPRNKKAIEEYQRIWDTSDRRPDISKEKRGVDGEWDKLKSRLREEGELCGDTQKRPKEINRLQISAGYSATRYIMRIAAVLVIAGLLGVLAYQFKPQFEPGPRDQALREISTEQAQRANTTLGDGTRVLLNADSKMTLPSEFASDIREVFLEGEAYFDVAGDPDKPFVIHSGPSVIRVLGTSFSVRSYPEDEQVRVVVREGRVSFEADDPDSAQKAIVKANELGRYSVTSNRIETRRVDDMELYLSWRDGYLKFRETPMWKVAKELERRYGIEIEFRHPDVQEMSLTALLKSRSIRNVLDVITVSLNIEYKLEKNNVTFYRE